MKRVIFSVCILIASAAAFAQKSEIFVKSGSAIGGYDPVAYFSQSKPVQGMDKFSCQWNGASWHFASQENLNAFKSNPDKYAPQFGGYCAYGVSENKKAPTEPDAWTIVNGKLYLNYNLKVKDMWSSNRDERIKTANKNWTVLKDKE